MESGTFVIALLIMRFASLSLRYFFLDKYFSCCSTIFQVLNEFSWFVISIMFTHCSSHFGMGVQLLIPFHLCSAQNLNVFTPLLASAIVQQSCRWNNYSEFIRMNLCIFSLTLCVKLLMNACIKCTLCRRKQKRTTHIASILSDLLHIYRNDFAHLHHTNTHCATWTRYKTVCSVTQSVI